MDCSATLPNELVLRFFDGFAARELCRLSCVSRRWHALARSHPTFWSHVCIREWEVRRGGLPCFLERMQCYSQAPVDVEVDFDLEVPTAVWTVISQALHRTTSFRLSSRVENWQLEFLDSAAPLLERLELAVWQPQPIWTKQAPTSLFAGYAPRLRSVRFSDVSFWYHTSPEASFPAVEHVDISYSSVMSAELPSDVFDRAARLFPNMTTLIVDLFDYAKGQPARKFSASALSASATATFSRLHNVELRHSPACFGTLQQLPLDDIPVIKLMNNIFDEEDLIRAILPPSDYSVTIEHDRACLSACIVTINSLRGDYQRVLEIMDGDSFRNSAVMTRAAISSPRLVSLSVDHIRTWKSMLLAVDALPALETLRLVFSSLADWQSPEYDGESDADAGRRRLHCPRLRTLILYGDKPGQNAESIRLRGSMVWKLFHSLAFYTRTTSLVLRDIVLEHDLKGIMTRFGVITLNVPRGS